MTPSRPYLIRALYEWIVDNRLTPYLVIADQPEAIIPHEHVQEGKIVLNISPEVIHGLAMGNDAVEFKARFSGVPRQIYAPMRTILAIYAKENGRGMVFSEEDMGDGDDSPPPVAASAPVRAKPNLKIIK
jgi:stringent starvation protein B